MVKIPPGLRPGRSCEKKKYNQDRTGQKSHKCVIFHIIWGKASRKDVAMKFGTRVDVLEVHVVTWAEFNLENLTGVNLTAG